MSQIPKHMSIGHFKWDGFNGHFFVGPTANDSTGRDGKEKGKPGKGALNVLSVKSDSSSNFLVSSPTPAPATALLLSSLFTLQQLDSLPALTLQQLASLPALKKAGVEVMGSPC